MTIRFSLLFGVMLIVLAPAAFAAEGARDQLEQFVAGTHALRSDFRQVVTDANGESRPPVIGNLALAEPRLFRWHTSQPTEQLIVADGSRVWVYDPELEQVTVRVQSAEEAHSPLTVLTDLSQLDEQFQLSEVGQRDGLSWLRLTPINPDDAQLAYAELGFDDKGLRRMLFRDQLGSVSTIRFDAWQRNPELPTDTFRFDPPAGVDVIGDLPVAQAFPIEG